MSAIRSGSLRSAEFSRIGVVPRIEAALIEAAVIDPEFARIGIVQPTRHAKAASQRESPAATAILKA